MLLHQPHVTIAGLMFALIKVRPFHFSGCYLFTSRIFQEWSSNIFLVFGLHFAWNVCESVLFGCVNSGDSRRSSARAMSDISLYMLLELNYYAALLLKLFLIMILFNHSIFQLHHCRNDAVCKRMGRLNNWTRLDHR
jgi:hypothetical protein